MDGDPYARLLETMHAETPALPLWLREGEVLRRAPLTIKVAELPPQKGEVLKLDLRLRRELDRELVDGVEKTLMPGSRVLLLTQDDQVFYLVCEVVSEA